MLRKDLVRTDPDFVNIKRFDYSLARLMDRYPDGAPDTVIADALMVDEAAVDRIYQLIIKKMRQYMVVI